MVVYSIHRGSIRNSLYYLVRQPYTEEQTLALIRWQLDWLLKNNAWTCSSLAVLFDYLLRTEVSRF